MGSARPVIAAGLFVLSLVPAPSALAQESCPLNFTAVGHDDGSVTFHWSGFGGADGYQISGHLGQGNTVAYSPMLGDVRDFTATNLPPGDYTFMVTAYHTGSVVASSCERTTHVGTSVPYFSGASLALGAIGALAGCVIVLRRRER